MKNLIKVLHYGQMKLRNEKTITLIILKIIKLSLLKIDIHNK